MSKRNLRLIGCGGRGYSDAGRVDAVLSRIHAERVIAEIIEGGQTGADTLCGRWADRNGVKRTTIEAEWERYRQPGRKNPAGAIRNAKMLELLPDGVVAFPGGPGTRNMVRQALAAGLPVMRIDWA